MDYIRGSRPRISVQADVESQRIQVPYLGNVGDARTLPEASSGYDRANWFAANTVGAPRARISLASGGKAAIGANARGIDGTTRDESWTDSYWTGYNVVNYPEMYTQHAEDEGSIWDVQTQASKGLNMYTWDQVYVNQDTQSIWS